MSTAPDTPAANYVRNCGSSDGSSKSPFLTPWINAATAPWDKTRVESSGYWEQRTPICESVSLLNSTHSPLGLLWLLFLHKGIRGVPAGMASPADDITDPSIETPSRREPDNEPGRVKWSKLPGLRIRLRIRCGQNASYCTCICICAAPLHSLVPCAPNGCTASRYGLCRCVSKSVCTRIELTKNSCRNTFDRSQSSRRRRTWTSTAVPTQHW